MTRRWLFFMLVLIAFTLLLIHGSTLTLGQAAAGISLEGIFHVVWGDGPLGSAESRLQYFLSTSDNHSVQLFMNDGLLSSYGGPIGLNQAHVLVRGAWLDGEDSLLVQSISLKTSISNGAQAVYGSQPWVSILCKFADYAAEPRDQSYFEGMYSSAYPGLDHFWRQNSYNLANLQGSSVAGWFVLPHNRDYYLPGGNLNWWSAAQDCTAVADPYVNFSPYVGLNLMFNADLDCCAWGGTWPACLDGVCKSWRITWEPPWGYANIGVIAHETGHGFGLPHSLGNCRLGYDNRWDVLSDLWSNGADPLYGVMGQHTIFYHKQLLGWATGSLVFTAPLGTYRTITMEKSALPQTGAYLGAIIPIEGDENHFYTLEVRQPSADPVNYDKWLPGFAVIIHEVSVGLSEPATLVDRDGDCVTGDAGAMYTPGEVFTDTLHGILVSIDGTTSSGYVVTINNRFKFMQEVSIMGAVQVGTGESLPLTATVTPLDASLPITYTWEATGLSPVIHVGGTQDTIDLAWDEFGTKSITVTATNSGGSVSDIHQVDVQPGVPSVILTGPSFGQPGDEYSFTAAVSPGFYSLPITYTWQATGQSIITHTEQMSDTITYIWEYPGTQVITVTAENSLASAWDTYSFPVGIAPTAVQVTGPPVGYSGQELIFTAFVTPPTTSLPLTYSWVIEGRGSITHTSGLTDDLILTWDHPGLYHLALTVYNPLGKVTEEWVINIDTRFYLPLNLRN